MGVVFLVMAAYIADKLQRPFKVALVYAIVFFMVGVIGGGSVRGLLLEAVNTLIFCSVYFAVLARVADNLMLWIIVLASFPIVLFTIGMLL